MGNSKDSAYKQVMTLQHGKKANNTDRLLETASAASSASTVSTSRSVARHSAHYPATAAASSSVNRSFNDCASTVSSSSSESTSSRGYYGKKASDLPTAASIQSSYLAVKAMALLVPLVPASSRLAWKELPT